MLTQLLQKYRGVESEGVVGSGGGRLRDEALEIQVNGIVAAYSAHPHLRIAHHGHRLLAVGVVELDERYHHQARVVVWGIGISGGRVHRAAAADARINRLTGRAYDVAGFGRYSAGNRSG